jgi:hypothetical protein
MAARARKVIVRTSATMLGALDALIAQALEERDLAPCGCSELVLAVNAAGAAPAPCTEQPHRDVETHGRDLDAFAAALADDAARGRKVALADIAYTGGAEAALRAALSAAGVAPLVHASGDEPLSVLREALGALL